MAATASGKRSDMSVKDHWEVIKGHRFCMRSLPGGEFMMGSEAEVGSSIWKANPIHPVQLSPFYIGEYPVTQVLWKAVMGEDNNPAHFKGDLRPVEQISWYDIVGREEEPEQTSFLDQLNMLTENSRPVGYDYRLPTEAEWEYAVRAGQDYRYAGSDQLKEVGWYEHNSHSETKEVGLKRPNDFGLYDMSGNVREWCGDWASDDYYQDCLDQVIVVNPTGPKEGPYRVIRGGSWIYHPRLCRVAYRAYSDPSLRNNDIGFRLVLAPSSAKKIASVGEVTE